MTRPLQILLTLLLLVSAAHAQTFVEGDYQLNRKKATAGFEVAELLAGDNITFGWNNTNKTLTIAGNSGTVTSFAATDSTGIDFTVTNPTTTPTLSLALTKAAVGLSNVENSALSTWAGSSNLTTLGTATARNSFRIQAFAPQTVTSFNMTAGAFEATLELADGELTDNRIFNFPDVSGTFITTGNLSSITTLGTITTGTWQGTAIADTYIASAATWNGKLDPTGDGSALTGITAAQVGAVANGDSPTFDEVTLTNGILNSPTGALAYNFYGAVNSSEVPFIAVSLYDDQNPAALIGSSLFGFRGDGAGSGKQIFQGSTNNFQFEGVNGANTATVSAATFSGSFTGSGANLSSLDAGDISTGTLATARLPTVPVANGGTGATTLNANAVLLGNGTSALQTVAPSTSGNVLTSNGTTWTSAAPTTGANPAGSGSELQFRSTGTAFGAVTNSSVSGGTLTLGNAEALGTTPTAYLTLRNTTAATSGNQQVSPSLVLEGQGWKTTATAASQTVRFRENVLPVQGTTNPSATWRLQSEINNSGTWADTISVESGGSLRIVAGTTSSQSIRGPSAGLYDSGAGAIGFCSSTTLVAYTSLAGFYTATTGAVIGFNNGDVILARDAAQTLAQRNSTAAQTYRLYETDNGANDEYLELSAASGTNLIRPQATGTGTASVVRYHTTTAVFWTSGSGSPESVVTAPIGSLYTRTDGGAATTLYVKESGTGSTGWVAK